MVDRLENEQKGWRISRIVIVAFWVLSLIVALFFIRLLVVSFFTGSSNLVSSDWAGYSVASDFTNPQPVIVGINGSWTVPTISASQSDVFSAAWIGIGGLFEPDSTLIQTGTEQDSISGNVSYSAWYELLPNDAVTITTINVSAGDEIRASISLIDSATNAWSIEMIDVAKRQSFQANVIYNSSRLSAEWIVERPTIGNGILTTLANFGNVTFTNSRAATTTSAGTITNFPFIRIIMQNRQNVQLASVSSLSSDGSSFTVTYSGTTGTTQGLMNRVAVRSKKHSSQSSLFTLNEEL